MYNGNMSIPYVYHTNQEEFEIHEEDKYDWCWLEMVASLDKPSLELVVGDGITGCFVMRAPGSYDYKTHRADRKHNATPQLRVKAEEYDFVIDRSVNGNHQRVRLHPTWSKNRNPQ